MQTSLADFIRETPKGLEADRILRACVHCGFCTATCPTYQVLGDELDGPRGRIYQIKQLLEGKPASSKTLQHLDRCLTCRSCETTCPSGVEYHKLLDIGRAEAEKQVPRPLLQRVIRWSMIQAFAYPKRFNTLLKMGQSLRPILPKPLKDNIPAPASKVEYLKPINVRKRMLILEGCVQSGLAPEINQAIKKILAKLDIQVDSIAQAGCCGALPHHLNDTERARAMAKQNIDAWYPQIEKGIEGIIVTASGCGAHIKEYAELLKDNAAYASIAAKISELCIDPVQVVLAEHKDKLNLKANPKHIAVHTPCTLQHGLGLNGLVEKLLGQLGYKLSMVNEGHLCCGSAGVYSMLQADISQQLKKRKLNALKQDNPDHIVTANIGCKTHLQEIDGVPVTHWVNLLAADLN